MTNRSFTIKLCLVVATAIASVACGSAATPSASAPTASVTEDSMQVAATAPHTMDVGIEFNDSTDDVTEEVEAEAHEPPATIDASDVTGAQAHVSVARR
jgi:hypothetical protein